MNDLEIGFVSDMFDVILYVEVVKYLEFKGFGILGFCF